MYFTSQLLVMNRFPPAITSALWKTKKSVSLKRNDLFHDYSCRFLNSAASNPSVTRREVRRFFRQVDVVPCPPVWEGVKIGTKSQTSPVSAGVDDTDSASGVQRRATDPYQEQQQLKRWLQPRIPGEAMESKDREWFTIRLDERPLRTPLGRLLAVPSESLAYALAAEWNCQVIETIRPTQMPLMALVSTAIDQIATNTVQYQKQTLSFLQTDTVCYWADPTDSRGIYRLQGEAWNELYEWIEDWSGGHRPGVAMGAEEGILLAKALRSGSSALRHPPALLLACESFVQSLDAWHLAAFHSIASEAKSFLVALALVANEQYASKNGWSMDVEGAIQAARVEEEFNIASWGLVEGGHDYDRLNCSVQMHAAAILKDALRQNE